MLQLSDTERRPWAELVLPELRSINVVSTLKNGHIAIGTQFDGLYILDEKGHVQLHLDRNKGLENSTILSVFEDRAGNLWLGHSNGITLVELSLPFRLIDQRMGVLGTGYAARTHQNALYLATNIHLAVLPPAAKDAYPVPNGEGQAYGLTQRGNELLVARHSGGYALGKNGLEALGGQVGVWGFLPMREQPDLFIAGTYNGLALYQKEAGGSYRLLHEIDGFKESCRLIQWESDGSLWMSHSYKGVYKLTLSDDLKRVSARLYGTADGLPTNLMNSVWKIGGRTLFTTEYGIYRYLPTEDRFEKDPTFAPYFEHDMLITSLAEDPVGNIFFIGNKEVGVLESQNDGSYKKNHQLFNKILPLLNDDLQNVSLIGPNEVLFAANEGFIRYTLRDAKAVPPQYPTLIRGIYRTGGSDSLLYRGGSKRLFDQEFVEAPHKRAQFPYSMRDLRFEFTNTIPNQELSTQFRFYLEGLENDYGEWTDKRDRAYTNLREGRYTFYVQSRDLYGQVSEAAAFSFSILPPWYRSPWAYSTYFVGALAFLFIGFKRLDRAYEQKTAAITAKQEEVIAETSSQLERSQQELEQLRTEKLEAEIQSKNKKLASATMQLLNKNEFIDHAKNHLNQIIKKSRNQEVKQELQKVITSIDKNIAQDNDWEQFELYFDQVHGDFMQRFKGAYPTLSPQEIKLTAYLRMNLSSKEMAYLMNISTRGVEIARYRLRKKLNLERSENLQEFILKF
ncbi:triple tyrosine motif-containing protein [Nitritalea halalkaliphila]|uniref:triple tyrosine motif-containing protein n=1 Tax=Nitritalea halalkaliphila TaxID=590849 RepID=UPI0002E264A0|nr:triple tyrosine motif-containing protein [Nitritalea halalkaliphila]